MNGHGKSDGCVVPAKLPNKARPAGRAAEAVEGRRPAKGNPRQRNMFRTLGRVDMPSELARIRKAARRDRKARFTALLHHVYRLNTLREAYFRLARHAAPGVDGQTWLEYGEGLEARLQDLSGRLRRGAYRARPVRRTYIEKANGRQRPLGVPVLEDKIVQGAVLMVLNAIYEVDFLGFSYGFRPGRGQHDALDALCVAIERSDVSWVLDADIRRFFDTIDHGWLTKFLEHRIADRRVVRLIQKWLKAGVLEDGRRTQQVEGTPQGGVISPLLGNIYLHYAFDLWVHQWRRRTARGDVRIVRYADDFVVGFANRQEAERFLVELGDRFQRFGLALHPEKTRLIEFGRYAKERRRRRGDRRPETFDFLGFTHICGTSRQGRFRVERHTAASSLRRQLPAINRELKRRRHHSIDETGAWLGRVVQGHFQYYGVPLNIRALQQYRHAVVWLWHKWLGRRSQRSYVRWDRMFEIADRWLPRARICHPYPIERFGVLTRGRSPVR